MNLEKLLDKDVAFITVKGVYDRPEGGTMLGFYVFINNKYQLNLETYWCVVHEDRAYNFLVTLFRRNVPCNYYIFEIKNSSVLTRIKENKEEVLIKTEKEGIYKINYTVSENSLDSILHKLVSLNAMISINGTYHNLYNLVFNRKSLNMSLRYIDKEKGYRTTPIVDIVATNIVVKTPEPFKCRRSMPSIKVGESYETSINLFDLMGATKYTISIDDIVITSPNKIDLPNISNIMDMEFMIYLVNVHYNQQVIVQILSGLKSLLFGKEDIKTGYSSGRHVLSENICDISPLYKIPTQSKFEEIFEKYLVNDKIDKDSIIKDDLSLVPSISNLVKKVIDCLDNSNLKLSILMLLEEHSMKFAQSGLVLHVLKGNIYTDQLLLDYYKKDRHGGDIYSTVFDTGMHIES